MAQSVLLEKTGGGFQLKRATVTLTHTENDLAGTSTEVLAANDDRKYALFINDSDVVLYLMVESDAEDNKGIRLDANGGSFEMVQGKNLDTRKVNALATDGTSKTLLVTEGS